MEAKKHRKMSVRAIRAIGDGIATKKIKWNEEKTVPHVLFADHRVQKINGARSKWAGHGKQSRLGRRGSPNGRNQVQGREEWGNKRSTCGAWILFNGMDSTVCEQVVRFLIL